MSLESPVAVSKFNRPDVGEHYPTSTSIFDGTIRKILLTPGTGVTTTDLLHIRDQLVDAGVDRMLINVDWGSATAPNDLEASAARELLASAGPVDFTVYSDSIIPYPHYDLAVYPKHGEEIVDTLASWGARCVAPPLFDPVEPTLRQTQLDRLQALGEYVRSIGLDFVLGFGDAGRTDFDYLVASIRTAVLAGAKRVDLYDSYCSLSVDGLRRFVRALRHSVGEIPLTLHTHDDFGSASATAAQAALLGLFPDVAVNGVSYRAGFAALEEVVAILEFQYDVRTGIDTKKLTALSHTVADLSGMGIHPLKSVTGPNLWVRGGSAAVGLLRDGAGSIEGKSGCFGASTVGATYRPVWDHRANRFAIQGKLELLGLPTDDGSVAAVEAALSEAIATRGGYPYWLEDSEMDALAAATLASVVE